MLLCAGGYFTLRLPSSLIGQRALTDKSGAGATAKGREGLGSMLLSLGGAVGVGNIAGVATAIRLGGPGAVFWMWICGAVGMLTKYSEVYLSVKYSPKGPFGYIASAFGDSGASASSLFAVGCVLLSFTVGGAFQYGAVTEAAAQVGLCYPVASLLMLIPVAVLLFSTGRAIKGFSAVAVPVMSIGYTVLTAVIIVRHADRLPGVLLEISEGAFGYCPALAGGAAACFSAALRQGVSKGLFSHEAGIGSSPIAYADSRLSPKAAGMLGMLEVLLDTEVICTLTALALLTSGYAGEDGMTAASEMLAAEFGNAGAVFLLAATLLFGIAASAGWLYYGRRAIETLGRGRAPMLAYRLCFIAFLPLSSLIPDSTLWGLGDVFMLLTALPNLSALYIKKNEIL